MESKAETTSTVQSYDSPVFAPVKIFLEKKASGDSYMNPSDMTGVRICKLSIMILLDLLKTQRLFAHGN